MTTLKLPEVFKETIEREGSKVDEMADKIADVLHDSPLVDGYVALILSTLYTISQSDPEYHDMLVGVLFETLRMNLDPDYFEGDSVH